MSGIRICFFSGDITRSGGTERVACMIANGLFRQKQYQVSILSLTEQSPDKKPFFPLNKRIARHSLGDHWMNPGPGYLALIPKLRRYLKQRKIDVMIDVDLVLDVLSVPAAWGTKTKVISWEHFNFDYENSIGYRRMISRFITPMADCIITLTAGDRQAFRCYYKHHKKRNVRIWAIHNPIQSEAGKPQQEAAEKRKWILTAGRLTHQKGMDYLVRTADLVLKKYSDWQWLILGDGEQWDLIQTQIKKRQLQGRLVLMGQVTDINRYLEQAQIFVLTSRYEGLPMCLLEAKAKKLPCVSFDIKTGPDEIIADGYNGFLIPAFDCRRMAHQIGRLIEDRDLRQSFSNNAMTGMGRFQLAAILNQWDEVIKRICG